MSIDHHFYVPAGVRNHPERRFSDNKFWSLASMREAGHEATKHQVFIAHGTTLDADILIDEQFYFEDAEDARWFYREGYKRMLYEGEAAPDRMALWIDGKEAGEVGYDASIKNKEKN